jgi:hypothetical protein
VNVHPEVALAGGYAVALLAMAFGLDWLAQHTQRRSERFRTAGFRYHPQHDAWICPQDQYLWPQEYDAALRVFRYRAKPSVCNACPVKSSCTSSQHGREIVRALDPWPHSEAGRFHRGLALVLVVLAGLFVVTAAILARTGPEVAVLLGVFLLVGVVGWRLTDHLRSTPANFPEPTSASGLRLTSPPALTEPLVSEHRTRQLDGIPASRSRWASDRRRADNREGSP